MVRIPLNSTGGRLLDMFCREMDDFVGRIGDVENWKEEMSGFVPRTNVAESDTGYELSLDVPGMSAGDFSIELHEGRLTITGERKPEPQEEGKKYHCLERVHGKFRRSFNLGQDVDANNVAAEYADGVLRVNVAKTVKAQPTKIEVK